MEEDKETPHDFTDHYGRLKLQWETFEMTEKEIYEDARAFGFKIKQTDLYKQYEIDLEKLQKDPELYERVLEYRLKNYEIQNNIPAEQVMDAAEKLEKEYEQLLENPIVENFLASELAFCRLMQGVNTILEDMIAFA